ncbi:MAG TPA: DUF86 domain-containing protein [Chloroflexota bacterium]|nr:DUF86 domain-containing protein [Chloroflexota bacterium]
MPHRQWKVRIDDMLESIERILRYTSGMDFAAFKSDERTIDAVMHNVEIIGEAARHIPAAVEAHNPAIPWTKMRGMRNLLIHQYSDVSIPILWQTVQEDIPPLPPLLRQILEQEP